MKHILTLTALLLAPLAALHADDTVLRRVSVAPSAAAPARAAANVSRIFAETLTSRRPRFFAVLDPPEGQKRPWR
jgi:hypothetical protein